ncbi:MAG: hypothetical protein ACWGMZ_00925 [Thermoguttaceae bacterium]
MRTFLRFPLFFSVLAVLGVVFGLGTIALGAEDATQSLEIVVPEQTAPANLVSYNNYLASAETAATAKKDSVVSTECEPNCGACSSCCCCDPHWIVGLEAVWLSPQLRNGLPSAGFSLDDGAATSLYSGSQVAGLFISPRITLGYQGELWGIQTRYWRFNETGGGLNVLDDPDNNYYFNHSGFKAETLDIEFTRKIYWRDTENILSFGVRYGELNQETNLSLRLQPAPAILVNGNSYAQNYFNGAGLTCGLTGLKPVRNNPNLNLFYSFRGSYLWDDQARNTADTNIAINNATIGYYESNVSNGDLFIGEVQVGAQWNFELVKNRADAFFRFALEYQYWATNNTVTASSICWALDQGYYAEVSGHAGNTRTDLIGFNIATGFTW